MSIKDQFSDLPISRQRKWQLRRAKLGLCIKCGEPVLPGFVHCENHHKKNLRDKPPSRARAVNTRYRRLKGKA